MSKPKHNRVMCPECFKQKMLFETQKQADNFIKWNGEDIDTHGGVLRSYFCPACGGYHISSKPYKESYKHNTENLINRFNNDMKTIKVISSTASKTEKIDAESEELTHMFIRQNPNPEKNTKSYIRELINTWIKIKGIEIEQSILDAMRHKVYKEFKLI